MLQEFLANNFSDDNGMPEGGTVDGVGLDIDWQAGPLGEEGPDRLEPNGAFVETVIAAALQRIEWYQAVSGGKFACPQNSATIEHLESAL
ncbi:hypothetical protein LCGC14_2078770, partial [marine sediment metagenome]